MRGSRVLEGVSQCAQTDFFDNTWRNLAGGKIWRRKPKLDPPYFPYLGISVDFTHDRSFIFEHELCPHYVHTNDQIPYKRGRCTFHQKLSTQQHALVWCASPRFYDWDYDDYKRWNVFFASKCHFLVSFISHICVGFGGGVSRFCMVKASHFIVQSIWSCIFIYISIHVLYIFAAHLLNTNCYNSSETPIHRASFLNVHD